MIKGYNGTLYGAYRQIKFTDVYSKVDDFMSDYGNVGVPTSISNELAETLFYLLYGKYGNSTIASSDITRFKYRLFSIIWQYGPTWEKKLDVQALARAWADAEVTASETYESTSKHTIDTTGSNTENATGKRLQNAADNPNTEPSADVNEPLPYINRQDYAMDDRTAEGSSKRNETGNNTLTSKRDRGKVDSYLALWDLLADDVTEKFLNRFKPLFIKFVQPELPLWYVDKNNQED